MQYNVRRWHPGIDYGSLIEVENWNSAADGPRRGKLSNCSGKLSKLNGQDKNVMSSLVSNLTIYLPSIG